MRISLDRIWLSSPQIGESEKRFIAEAFSSNWIAPVGPNVDAFELQLARFLNVNSAVALNSGTAAIHLALRVLGVKKNDVVFCQSFTFAASAFPILYNGSDPVFIDSEPETWNMDARLLEQAIEDCLQEGKRPGAIVVVHAYGMPANMKAILEVAHKFQIPVVEDAAEALGSHYLNDFCGSIGDLGVLSFNGNKIITTSGGGALLSNNKSLIEKARFLSTQAKDDYPYYVHSELGFNYRMSNVLAGIGRGQMELLSSYVDRRRTIHGLYQNFLGDHPAIQFLDEPYRCFANRWLTTILIDPEVSGGIGCEEVRLHLAENNIETRRLWNPMHRQPLFADAPAYVNGVSDSLFERGLCLPSGSNLSDEDIFRVASAIKYILNSKRQKTELSKAVA
jgi:dTDP-4-amino-4,6-dideoxygalactose transaminase